MKLVFLFALLNMSLAHEGHNKAPGTEMAPHGGVMQGTSQYYFELVSELVSEVSVIKLYPLNHDLKAIPIAQLAVSATSQVPKKAKESVKLIGVEDHFEGNVNAKGAHRYLIELVVKYQEKKQTLTFQVEPQN